MDSEKKQITLEIQNLKGLHARATSVFVQCADSFVSEITIQKQDMCVSGKSVMGILMLGAAFGEKITLTAFGPDSDKAIETLSQLVNNKFGEEP